jgi:hypothetical protein
MERLPLTILLISLSALFAGCSDGSDGATGAIGATGAAGNDARDQIARLTETLEPGETITLSHDLAAYESDVTFVYGGRTYDAEEFSSVYQAVDITSAVTVLETYDTVSPYDESSWNNTSLLKTSSGFTLFAKRKNDTDDEFSFVKTNLDEDGATVGDRVIILDPTETILRDSDMQVIALNSGNYLLVYNDEAVNTVEFLVFDEAGTSVDTRTLASHKIKAGFGVARYNALTQNNEVVTCLLNESGAEPVLQLYITPLGAGDALGTSTTVNLFDNGVATLTAAQDDVIGEKCALTALAGGGVAVLHETGDTIRDKTHVSFFDEDFAVTSTTEVSSSYIAEVDIACNAEDECLFVYELGGPDAYVYYKSNPEGTDTFGPHPFTDHEYDEDPVVAAFPDGTFMIVAGEDDSIMSAKWNIAENGVAEEKQLFAPLRTPGFGDRHLVATGPYTAKLLYEGYDYEDLYVIDVHKNQLKVEEAEGSFTVTNESAHTVETSVTLVGVSPDP